MTAPNADYERERRNQPYVGQGSDDYTASILRDMKENTPNADSVSVTYERCPNYPGQWYHKSTGACSCGSAHSLLDQPRQIDGSVS